MQTPMAARLLDPADPPERQREKLMQICEVLMRRSEQLTDDAGAAYAQFQRAVLLEDQVSARTRDLERTLDLLHQSNARLEQAGRETETARQNLANAIETVQEGFALFDAQDVLVMCNSRFGLGLLDIRDALRPGLAFDDYVGMASRSRFLELPEGETPEDWAIRRRHRHGDRHVIFNVRMTRDRWMQVSEHRTADGGTVILQTDVTDLIRLEREARGRMLDDQARIIRATLDHIGQGVAIFDDGGRLAGWNQRLADLLAIPLARIQPGLPFDALGDRLPADLTFGDGMTAARLSQWAGQGRGRPDLAFELSRGPLILQGFGQEMPDGGFVISFTDITAEREAIAALEAINETLEARVLERTLELEDALADAERANASRSRFVAAASHDLLQPLSAARLFIASAETADPAVAEPLRKAQNALDSVEGILGALLDISKLESGRLAVQLGPVQLDRVLGPLREEFTVLAAAKGLRLTVMPCGATVLSDAAYLRRILQNLIGNAVRYTATGRVLVGARRRGAMLRLEVHDTGPGIPEAEQDNIFKEFHRLDAPASASEGMGLGLAIVERACAALGHPLGLASQLGRGSCFMVQLPLAEAAATPAAAPRPHLLRGLQGRIALLVEPEPEQRRVLVLMLEKWGLSALETASAAEARALIDEIGILPDVVLTAEVLEEATTGLAFVAGLRAEHGPIPACLIAVPAGPALAAACAAAGVVAFGKPLDPRALQDHLAGLFAGPP